MRTIITFMAVVMALCCMAQKNICSLQCAEGGLVTSGCTLVQHNSVNVPRINMKSCGNYVISMVGKKEALQKEDGSADACYFVLTLTNGETFKAGDVLSITGMRNVKRDGKATLYFVYSNGAVMCDDNVWNNLGILEEKTFGGGTENGGSRAIAKAEAEYSQTPSTYSFVVSGEADGSASVTLTRNDSDVMLYLTSIAVTRNVSTSVDAFCTSDGVAEYYDINGHQLTAPRKGVTIVRRNGSVRKLTVK